MLGWVIAFLIFAIVAAIFGFGGVAGTAVSFAVILFWIFLALFVVTLIVSLATGGRTIGPTQL